MQTPVESRKNIAGGKLVLKGTRFTVSQLLSQIASGDSIYEVADNFELDLKVIQDTLNYLSSKY